MVMEADAVMHPSFPVWRILRAPLYHSLDPSRLSLLQYSLKILSDALTRITIFKQEHRLFRDEFRFNQRYFRQHMYEFGQVIGGFLQLCGETNPALHENGLLVAEEHSMNEEQAKAYAKWM